VEYLLLDGEELRPILDESVDAVLSYGVCGYLQHWDFFNYLVEIEPLDGGSSSNSSPSEVGAQQVSRKLTVMTPQLFTEFSTRAGLDVVEGVTDVVKRDASSLLQKHAA
jgi:hypothetical protein